MGVYVWREKETGFEAVFQTKEIHESLYYVHYLRCTEQQSAVGFRTRENTGEIWIMVDSGERFR